MSGPIAVLMVAAADPVARASASASLLLDLPDAVVVSHDLHARSGSVRRMITDASGLLSDDTNPIEHACLSCTVRDDIVPTVQMLAALGRWQTIVVALPLTAAPGPVAAQLGQAIDDGALDDVELRSVISVVDLAQLEDDLLGDDLLNERAMALGPRDRRSVGEAVAAQIEFADIVIAMEAGSSRELTLLRHLVAPTSQLWIGLHEVDVDQLLNSRRDGRTALGRIDLVAVRPSGAVDDHDVWTLDLHSERPLHPRRLLDQIERLGTGRIRSRGVFWLPSRPLSVCSWDGAGGQLSIQAAGSWGIRQRRTRLVVTGVGAVERDRIRDAFADVIMTAEELRDLESWQGLDDGLGRWLGSASAAA